MILGVPACIVTDLSKGRTRTDPHRPNGPVGPTKPANTAARTNGQTDRPILLYLRSILD